MAAFLDIAYIYAYTAAIIVRSTDTQTTCKEAPVILPII